MRKQLMLAVVVALVVAAPARGASVTYNGGIFSLDLASQSADGTQFTVIYTADLANFTGDDGQQDYIYGVGFMPAPANISGFSGSSGYGWSFRGDELSANGCSSGNDSFACASTWDGAAFQTLALATASSGSTLTWTFVLTYASPVSNFSLDGVSIKAAFSSDNSGVNQRGLMSLTTASVPEPGSLAFLGVGLLGAAIGLRRFHKEHARAR